MNLKKIMFTSLLVFSFLGTTLGGTVASADGTNGNGNSGSNSSLNRGTTSSKSLSGPSSGTASTKGTLQLNDVPNLSFKSDNNDPSKDDLNYQSQNDNGNNNKLVVTDYRDHSGWNLNASITNLKSDNDSYIPDNAGDWKMNLDTGNIQNHTNNNYAPSNSGNNSLDVNGSQTNNSSNSSSNENILTTNDQHTGYGVNEVDFNNQNNTNLDVPNVKSGSYTITMNWSLSPNASSGNTNT